MGGRDLRLAVTREISPSIRDCELSFRERVPIDLERAGVQHRVYEDCLVRLGCELKRLPPEPELPDAVFVEDCALVLPELAVITRPGATSRRAETVSVAAFLGRHRSLAEIAAPATLDGGDVLVLGKRIFVGLSGRSGEAAISQLDRMLVPHDYRVSGVEIRDCLHLKSAAAKLDAETILINPDRVDAAAFSGFDILHVDPAEPEGAQALAIGKTLLCPAAFPRTRELLTARDLDVLTLDLSELAKAEGGVTCCSIIFDI